VLWPLKLLAAMGSLSASTFFITLFYLLVSGFTCTNVADNSFWASLNYDCYNGGHLAQVVITVLLTVTFVILCSLFTLVYYDSNPVSAQLGARVHGRMDFLFLFMKMVLVITVEVWPHSFGTAALTAIVMTTGILWWVAHLISMPFTHHSMNQLSMSISTCYLWAGTCLVIANAYDSTDAALLLYVGLPFAFLAGQAVADRRVSWIRKMPVTRFMFAHEVELKMRYLLHTAIWGHPTDDYSDHSDGGIAGARPPAALTAAATTASTPGMSTVKTVLQKVGFVFSDTELDNTNENDARVAQCQKLISREELEQCEEVLKAGLSLFRNSALLQVLAARFYSYFAANHHLEMR
jgi:hypothetical protein